MRTPEQEALRQQWQELEDRAGYDNVTPVVTTRWGYAGFVAYIFRISHSDKPTEWWVAELDEDRNITIIKQICNY